MTPKSGLLYWGSCAAIAAVGSIFELASGEPDLGSLATSIILAISIPLGISFLCSSSGCECYNQPCVEPTPLAVTKRTLVAKTISQPMSGKDLSGFLRQLLHTGVAAPQLAHYSLSTTQVVIGRDPSCEIVLDSNLYGMVSRRHAAVRPCNCQLITFPHPFPWFFVPEQLSMALCKWATLARMSGVDRRSDHARRQRCRIHL